MSLFEVRKARVFLGIPVLKMSEVISYIRKRIMYALVANLICLYVCIPQEYAIDASNNKTYDLSL